MTGSWGSATWNLANFGEQRREGAHHRLIAEMLSWFDLVALQEIKENFGPLEEVVRLMGASYRYLMSDLAGNRERLVFVYDARKVTLLEEMGEIALAPAELGRVRLPGIRRPFGGFDRNPYLATFQAGRFSVLLVNVHLFFGSEARPGVIARRQLETFAVARWVDQRRRSRFAFTRGIVALGDFNMPKAEPADPIYRILTSRGLHLPAHPSKMGSNLESDRQYDQIAFLPGETGAAFTGRHGVFDYDRVVFPDLWDGGAGKRRFNQYVRYYLSDHRPMWMEFGGG